MGCKPDPEVSLTRPISFKRHRFPPDVIQYAVWLYFRFTLSIRDVEELLAQRGIEVSREAVRCWVIKFGPQVASSLTPPVADGVGFEPTVDFHPRRFSRPLP
jgi:hypothetical protein